MPVRSSKRPGIFKFQFQKERIKRQIYIYIYIERERERERERKKEKTENRCERKKRVLSIGPFHSNATQLHSTERNANGPGRDWNLHGDSAVRPYEGVEVSSRATFRGDREYCCCQLDHSVLAGGEASGFEVQHYHNGCYECLPRADLLGAFALD
jgi:hypothetical protein